MSALIVGSILGSGVSIVFWSVAIYLSRPLLGSMPSVRRSLAYMTAAAFILIDIFAFAIVGKLAPELVGSLFAFATGLQTTAALAAIITIRRNGRP